MEADHGDGDGYGGGCNSEGYHARGHVEGCNGDNCERDADADEKTVLYHGAFALIGTLSLNMLKLKSRWLPWACFTDRNFEFKHA